MMDITSILENAAACSASDIFIVAGLPLSIKVRNQIQTTESEVLTPAMTEQLVADIYGLAFPRTMDRLNSTGDDDFSFSLKGVSRFRVSTYRQRGSLAAVIRVVRFLLPDPSELGIPDVVLELANRRKGLVLVTGSAGSGKSTTLACIIDRINSERADHVITLEDPLEFLHRHKKSIVSQREVSSDTKSYVAALRAALRQAPDVILLGEMRDHETITTAMTAAETGHLIFSTLHTVGAANTIDRVIDAFPPTQQGQIRVQLSMVLQAVVSQQLVPSTDGGIVPVFEVMFANSAVRNMIRESKIHQIDTVLLSSADEGMRSMDTSLLALFREGTITRETALMYSTNPTMLAKKLQS